MSDQRPSSRRCAVECIVEGVVFVALLYAPLVYLGACAHCASAAGGGQ